MLYISLYIYIYTYVIYIYTYVWKLFCCLNANATSLLEQELPDFDRSDQFSQLSDF